MKCSNIGLLRMNALFGTRAGVSAKIFRTESRRNQYTLSK